jgi:hypothetical protein
MAEVITGVRAKLRLDGKDIGYAVNVAISSDIEYGAIRTRSARILSLDERG